MHEQDLVLNNLQSLICHKANQPTNQPIIVGFLIYKYDFILKTHTHTHTHTHIYESILFIKILYIYIYIYTK